MKVVLSVLVAVHDAEKYLPRLVRSLAQNRITGMEYIFVVDGSTDDSLNVLKSCLRLEGIDECSVIVVNSSSKGIGFVRQQLFDLARGVYFIYADSDDYVDTGMYEGLLRKAQETNADFVWEDYYEDGHTIKRIDQSADSTSVSLLRKLFRGEIHGSLWNKLISRAAVNAAGISFLPGVNCCEDFYLLVRLLIADCNAHYVSDAHYHYVLHGGSITHRGGFAMASDIWRVALKLEPQIPNSVAEDWLLWKRKKCCDIILDHRVSESDSALFFPDIVEVSAEDVGMVKCLLFRMARSGKRHLVVQLKRFFCAARAYIRGH